MTQNTTLKQVWETTHKEREFGSYPNESAIRFIAKNYKSRNDKSEIKILEVGCGAGPNIWFLSREGYDAYGIDISSQAIERVKGKLALESLSANLLVGDISEMPYPDNYFDAVLDCECIYCNNHATSAGILSSIKRILKDDGLFYSRTFTDKMFVGANSKIVGHREYEEVYEGPLKDKGFVRLADEKDIYELYGKLFSVQSLDLLEWTDYNRTVLISEWVVVCRK